MLVIYVDFRITKRIRRVLAIGESEIRAENLRRLAALKSGQLKITPEEDMA